MSSSRLSKFSASELQALNPWTGLQRFGEEAVAEAEPQALQTLTVEEIEATQKQAYEEAFNQGRSEGFTQGQAEGYEAGRAQGYEDGRKQGYEENLHLLQKQAAELVLLMESLCEPFQKLDETVEDELVKLAVAIAGQVVHREIKLNPGEIVGVIRAALNALPVAAPKVTLSLHPDDADLVRQVLKLDENLPPWRLLENPLLSRGGCVVETDTSRIDASVEGRLAAVVANLLGGDRRSDSHDSASAA